VFKLSTRTPPSALANKLVTLSLAIFAIGAGVFSSQTQADVDNATFAYASTATDLFITAESLNNQNRVPLSLLHLRGDYDYALAVDLSINQMFVFTNDNGTPRLKDTFFATIGKKGFGKQREGDNLTPVGIYRIQEFLDDKELPELYGSGALPLNFPNDWDANLGRTGSGIWIHGMPRDQERRPALDSRGCVVIDNQLIPEIHNWAQMRSTPVILADKLHWGSKEVSEGLRNELLDVVEDWRNNWASGDMDSFLAMHSPKFRNAKQTFKQYAAQKRWLAEKRGRIGVHLEEFEIFAYPDVDHKQVAMVSFKQYYSAADYKDVTFKTQYWQKVDDRWLLKLERPSKPWPSNPNAKLLPFILGDE